MLKLTTVVFLLSVSAAMTGMVAERQVRRETKKTTPSAGDLRPNNPNVPDVYALTGKLDRVVVLRFKYQTDLLKGLERMVKEQKIRNAVILAGIGSVRNYQIHSVSTRTFPSDDTYVQDPTAPADIVGMNGYVVHGQVHAHLTLANPDRAFGGHLEPNTNVFTFAIVTLGVLDGVDLSKVDDETYR